MESNTQTINEWRYYRLTGKAKLEKVAQSITVTLLDEDGTPNQPPLKFDSPLKYLTREKTVIASITADELSGGAFVTTVDFSAGFDEAWFEASKAAGFKFTNPPVVSFIDLEAPDGDPMSVVRP